MSAWATFPSPAMPWEGNWHDSWLNEQEFWILLAKQYGNLAALRCFERYETADTTRLGAAEVFEGCGGGETVAVWMWATNADDEHAATQQSYEIAQTVESISYAWLMESARLDLFRRMLIELERRGEDVAALRLELDESQATLDEAERRMDELTGLRAEAA